MRFKNSLRGILNLVEVIVHTNKIRYFHFGFFLKVKYGSGKQVTRISRVFKTYWDK